MAVSTINSTGSTSSLADYSDVLEESSEVPEVTNCADHSTEQPAVLLLNRLCSPGPSELSRRRNVHLALQVAGEEAVVVQATLSRNLRVLKPEQRIREYLKEPFIVSNNALFCSGCREELCIKSSSIKNHCHSAKHQEGKVNLGTKQGYCRGAT